MKGRLLFALGSTLLLTPVLSNLSAQAAPTQAPAADNSSMDDGLNLRYANGIAAVVDDRVITVDDIRRELARYLPDIRRESHNQKEFQDKIEKVNNEIVKDLIDRILIVKDFYKDERRKIPESYVDNSISETITNRFDGDRSKFLAYLRLRGITFRDYRKEVEEDIIYSYQRGQQRRNQSVVSPAKVEQYYKDHQADFAREDTAHLRMIQFNRGDQTDEQLLARAKEVIARFNKGEKFEDLAKEYSEDSRKARGGDWGWQKRSDLKPEFSDPLFKLKAGEISEPILDPLGCFILYAEEQKPAGIPSIDEVRGDIESILAAQMSRESEERWLDRLRRDSYIKLY